MTLRPNRPQRCLAGNRNRLRRPGSSSNGLHLEALEARQLLAIGPQLLGIQPDTGAMLADGQVRHTAPHSLAFQFEADQTLDAQTLDGIRISRSGTDGVFGNGNDVIVAPGLRVLGERPAEVVIHFAEPLPEDSYRIEIFGFDAPAQGIEALRNVQGEPHLPADPAADRTTLEFQLVLAGDLAAGTTTPFEKSEESFDFGDAPDPPYATLLASDGARHALGGNLWLGTNVASEADGQADESAALDAEDDGVVFEDNFNAHVSTPITVSATTAGVLDAWLDFNADGDWDDAGEQIFFNQPLEAGANQLAITPATEITAGFTYARFRLSSSGDLTPAGLANDGEVEDYRVEILPGTPPVALDDEYTTGQDNALVVAAPGIFTNDTDAEGDPLTLYSADSTSTAGVPLMANADGSFTYDPSGLQQFAALPAGSSFSDSFNYQATDGSLQSEQAAVRIEVTGNNDAPTAMPDAYTVNEDGVLNLSASGLLANDHDIDQGDPYWLAAIAGTDTLSGTSALGVPVSAAADGSFSYDPTGVAAIQALSADETLLDTLSYTLADASGATSTTTVTMTLVGANDAPTAANDAYSVSENSALDIDSAAGLLANDTDPDINGSDPDDAIEVASTEVTSTHGVAVQIDHIGAFRFDPGSLEDLDSLASGSALIDTFSYAISDGKGGMDLATVSITIHGENDSPAAGDDSYAAHEDEILSVASPGVLHNDADVDQGDPISAIGSDTTSAWGAEVVMQADGSFTYNPTAVAAIQALAAGANFTDTFHYTIADNSGATSTATVSLQLSGRNDSPLATPDEYTISQDTQLIVNVGEGLQANDSDVDSEQLTTTVLDTSALEGQLFVNTDGSFIYDPRHSVALLAIPLGSTESFTFTYTLTDNEGATSTATVTFHVVGANDPPTANSDIGYATDEETQIQIPIDELLSNDSDPDNDPLTLTPPAFSKLGVPLIVNAMNETVYDPAGVLDSLPAGMVVADEFTYTIDDGNGGSALTTVAIVVTGLNDDPSVISASLTTTEDSPLMLSAPGLLQGASDTDQGSLLTLADVQSPSDRGAAITFQANGSILYNPINSATLQAIAQGDQVTDTFTYTVSDGNGGLATATATVTVTGLNDRPDTSADVYGTNEGAVLSVAAPTGVLANDTDVDSGDSLTAAVANNITTLGATVTMQADGSFTYDPSTSSSIILLAAGEQVVDSFVYMATDLAGGNSEGTVTITVLGVNDHPWRNEALRFDVNNNGFVSNGDALLIISRLRQMGPSQLPVPPNFPLAPPPFYDVDGNDLVTLNDALEIVRFLTESFQAKNGGSEGEGEPIVDAVEKASTRSLVSSSDAALKPVKLAPCDIVIEAVADPPTIDLFLASGTRPGKSSAGGSQAEEREELSDALDMIAADINDVWA